METPGTRPGGASSTSTAEGQPSAGALGAARTSLRGQSAGGKKTPPGAWGTGGVQRRSCGNVGLGESWGVQTGKWLLRLVSSPFGSSGAAGGAGSLGALGPNQ